MTELRDGITSLHGIHAMPIFNLKQPQQGFILATAVTLTYIMQMSANKLIVILKAPQASASRGTSIAMNFDGYEDEQRPAAITQLGGTVSDTITVEIAPSMALVTYNEMKKGRRSINTCMELSLHKTDT